MGKSKLIALGVVLPLSTLLSSTVRALGYGATLAPDWATAVADTVIAAWLGTRVPEGAAHCLCKSRLPLHKGPLIVRLR